ncbi:MAG: recombinase family protein [Pseudomonadota bacterium]
MKLWPPPMVSPDRAGRVIGYARVSTPDQKLDHQLDLLKRIQCNMIFFDHGVSGGKGNRQGLNKALDELRNGDLLVVYKLDRLGRSVLHLTDLINRFDEEGIHLCSLTEGIDTTTSGGKLIFHIFAAVAEFHRDLIRENTRNGLKAARVRGKKLGRPRKLTGRQVESAYIQMVHESLNVHQIASRFEVSSSTLVRGFQREGFVYTKAK